MSRRARGFAALTLLVGLAYGYPFSLIALRYAPLGYVSVLPPAGALVGGGVLLARPPVDHAFCDSDGGIATMLLLLGPGLALSVIALSGV